MVNSTLTRINANKLTGNNNNDWQIFSQVPDEKKHGSILRYKNVSLKRSVLNLFLCYDKDRKNKFSVNISSSRKQSLKSRLTEKTLHEGLLNNHEFFLK